MGATILIIEDEAVLARNIQRFLKLRGDDSEIAGTMESGMEAYGRLRPDVILMDHNLPDGTGLDLLKRIRGQDRQTKIVMMTAHGSVQIAVEAMKAGADDYLAKPMALDEIGMLVAKLVDQSRLESSLTYFKQREERRGGIASMIGESAPMRELKDRIQRLVSTEARLTDGPPPAVLILGETGTGKELIARALHYGSARRAQPFIELNCAALPEHLVESELFGHERGAFTDAKERKQGLFVAADKGTLFLDEIGELPLPIQAKLLKTLEQRTVRPVGSVRERGIDVRVVAATNTAIEDQVRNGEFRNDLYFRLGVVTINAPPLRERGADVILLAEHFLEQFSRSYGRPRLSLAPGAAEALRRHPWPGNVRELRNVMEQAVLFAVGQSVDADDLRLREPLPLRAPTTAPDASSKAAGTLTDVERDLIQRALAVRKGNVTLAARDLGISRDTLRYRMERHGLRREQFV